MTAFTTFLEDSMEDAMQPYTSSDEYKAPRTAINNKIKDFRNTLTEDQKKAFNSLMDDMNNSHAAFASKAYVYGAMNGIALREEAMHLAE